jgi:chemotaxis protein histidine kinase CheA
MNANPARKTNPPNPLADKVVKGGPNAVNADVLDRAERIIVDASSDFLGWVKDDLSKLRTALSELTAGGDSARALEQLFDVAHDMKGQGGSFGYDLVTVIADHMCRLLEKLDVQPDDIQIEILQLYVDALHIVIAKGLTADGGPEGRRLLDGLTEVSAKLT